MITRITKIEKLKTKTLGARNCDMTVILNLFCMSNTLPHKKQGKNNGKSLQ